MAVFASRAGFHPSNLLFPTGVVAGAFLAMSANVLLAVFSTYTVFSAATVPFVVSADSNVTAQYLFASGFFPSGFVGSFGPTISFSKTAVNVVWATVPVFSDSFCPFPSLSFHATKFFVTSVGVGDVGSTTARGVAFLAWSHFNVFFTS